jgi:hypothetical protein
LSFPVTLGNRLFLEGLIENVSLQAGLGFYRLAFSLKLQIAAATDQVDGELTDITADVRIGGSSILPRPRPTPGQLPLKSYDHSYSRNVQLEIELSREQLEAMEVVRNGGDVALGFTYHLTLTDAAKQTHYAQSSDGYQISQSDWIRMLKDARFSRITLLEVPSFETDLSPALAAASNHLRKAHEALLRGEYRSSVGLCRDVLEALDQALHDKEDLSQEVARQRDLDKAGRLRLVRNAAKVFTHAARHEDEVTSRFEWTRTDATFIISLTTAVISELAAPGAIGEPFRTKEVAVPGPN